MNVLEKILEEVEERIEKLKEVDNMCRVNAERNRNFKSAKYFQSLMFATERAKSIIGDIIRSHMDEAKDINAPSNDDWISVEERLPEHDYETVLCVDAVDYYFVAVYTKKDGFRTEDFGADYENIIAWQPLPEPYRLKEQNNGK